MQMSLKRLQSELARRLPGMTVETRRTVNGEKHVCISRGDRCYPLTITHPKINVDRIVERAVEWIEAVA